LRGKDSAQQKGGRGWPHKKDVHHIRGRNKSLFHARANKVMGGDPPKKKKYDRPE